MTLFLPARITSKAPPIKIQGIKTKLVPFIARSIRWSGKGRWVEPFLGSAAVALNIAPDRALLSDTNEHVIRFYQKLQSGEITAEMVKEHLVTEGSKLLSGEDHYYVVRDRFNRHKDPLDLVFLNRSCFNGVMRFNKKGGFNVPFCRKPDRFRQALVTKICNQIDWATKIMRNKDWEFKCQDWRVTLAESRSADFVYLDPPYIGRHTDYYNQWLDEDADALVRTIKQLPCGFAYSMWKENKYRENAHLIANFTNFPMVTFSHFYHIGASEGLRNHMEEALVIKLGYVEDKVLPIENLTQAVLPF